MTRAIMGHWSVKISIRMTVTISQIFHYFTGVHSATYAKYTRQFLRSEDCLDQG